MIMQDVDDTNSSGLSYKGLLHLLVTPLATLPADGELLAMNAANELLLGGISSLAEKPDIEDADMLVLEMRRLDQKLSLVLDLLNTLLRINDPLPPPQLVLLQKTLLNIEGLGRQLDPELDLWKTAKPFLERWMQEQIGWRGLRNHRCSCCRCRR